MPPAVDRSDQATFGSSIQRHDQESRDRAIQQPECAAAVVVDCFLFFGGGRGRGIQGPAKR